MEQVINKYCKKVALRLCGKKATIKSLVQGLACELNELPKEAVESMATLQEAYGPVNAVSSELQASIPEEEVQKIRRRRKIIICSVVGVLVLVTVCSISYGIDTWNNAWASYDVVITEG